MSGSTSIVVGVARQCTKKLLAHPQQMVPALLLPLLMFAAFSGALSSLGSQISYYNYTAFIYVFVLFHAAVFGAAFTAMDVGADFASGWGSRMMLAVPQRIPIIFGYQVVALARGLFGIAVTFGIAVLTGMPVRGGVLDIAAIIVLGLLLNQVAMLYGTGISLRFQSTASGVLILIPCFMVMFLVPVFVPLSLLTGWLRDVADVNPITALLEAARGLMANAPVHVALAFAASAGMLVVAFLFAFTGMRKAERGPAERTARPRRALRLAGGGAGVGRSVAPASGDDP
jgi:ABC-2 type transport system permease protein